MDNFSKTLMQERINQGISRKAMAEALKIPPRTYKSYELLGANHREPEFEMLVKIADILNVTTDYLLGREI